MWKTIRGFERTEQNSGERNLSFCSHFAGAGV
jgi:hypothetical protein